MRCACGRSLCCKGLALAVTSPRVGGRGGRPRPSCRAFTLCESTPHVGFTAGAATPTSHHVKMCPLRTSPIAFPRRIMAVSMLIEITAIDRSPSASRKQVLDGNRQALQRKEYSPKRRPNAGEKLTFPLTVWFLLRRALSWWRCGRSVPVAVAGIVLRPVLVTVASR